MQSWNGVKAAWPLVVLIMTSCTTGGVDVDEDAGRGGPGSVCGVDADCNSGSRCQESRCVPESCTLDSQCPPGQGCNNGTCGASTTCSDNGQCSNGEVCVAGVCQTGCADHDDCGAAEHCENGSCLPGAHCDGDSNCRATEICAPTGVCVTGCRANEACATGQVCTGNHCGACSDHAQCDNGSICESGVCRPGCILNADCPNGEVCVDHACGACSASDPCGVGFSCVAGACVALTPCATQAQCGAAEHCDGNFCIPNSGCGTTQDCTPSQSCVAGTCTRNDGCSSNAECTTAQQCIQGVCTWNAECATSATCPVTMGCVGGHCTTNPACTTDTMCPETQRCHNGLCTRNDTCTTDTQCPAAQSCVAGACTRNPTCSDATDCTSTQSCVANVCVRNPACTQEVDCAADQSCVMGLCTRNPGCAQDQDCTQAQSCVNATCTDNGMCTSHNNCPVTQYCQGNLCTRGPQCTADADCPTTNTCSAGRCELNPACTVDAECRREQHCEAAVCTRNPPCEAGTCPLGQGCFMGQCVQTRDCTTDAECQDTTLCNGLETCDLMRGGVCTGGTAPVINDNNPCTEDVCAPATGAVTHTPRNTLCADQNVCTLDTCDVVLGCLHDPDPTGVPAQTTAGDCRREVCQGTTAVGVVDNADVPSSDGIACSVEECVAGVPRSRLVDADCNDSNACNGVERCVAAQGCRPPATPFACPAVGACSVGFCDPAGGCGSRPLDADNDGHFPVACGGDDCNDTDPQSHTGHVEVPGDGRDNNCNGFTDEGFGLLACPAPPGATPPSPRILDPISLTATISGAAAGTYALRWTVVAEPQSNSLALQNAATPTVSFTPVIRGQYKLRARLTQTGATDQTCDVTFTVEGPDEDFNAQLVMRESIDVDLHVIHPLGGALENASDGYFYDWNWGPINAYSCWDGLGWYTCASLEDARLIPDCHWSNCGACTVTVPGQPACEPTPLQWNVNTTGTLAELDGTNWSYSYPFAGGGAAISVDANPKLDIDNRRGCYTDTLGSRVCTPENISIRHPGNAAAGRYTIAVHYWGEPLVQSGADFTGNARGVAPPGQATANVDVEVFCKGVGFRKYRCNNIPVDGWCFVADAVWNAATSQCSAISAPTRTFAKRVVADEDGVRADTAGPDNVVGVLIQ